MMGASPSPKPEPTAEVTQTFGALMGSGAPSSTTPGDAPGGPGSNQGSGPLRNRAGPTLPSELVDVVTQLRRDERTLDRSVRRALAGHDFDMPQLVALQSLAFKYSQRVELLGKLVDRLAGAVKQTLQMQV